MNKFAAIIVTYNRKKLLEECLEAIYKQQYKFEYIILVDNCSNDGTKELIKNKYIKFLNFKYIRLNENIGGAGGYYYGLKYFIDNIKDIEWAVLLDDDAILDDKFLLNINKVINQKKDVKALSGVVSTNNKIDLMHRRRLVNKTTLKQTCVPYEEYKKDIFTYNVFSFVGCVINREIIRKIGLPNKDYFIWYDDTEYSLRVNNLTQIINVNSSIVNHKTKVNNNKVYKKNWKEYYGFRNRFLTIKKHTQNKFIANIYILLTLIKSMLGTIIKKKYRENRIYRLNLLFCVLKDVMMNISGKNKAYLP